MSSSYTLVASPVGSLLLVGRPGVLTGLYVSEHGRAPVPDAAWSRDDEAFVDARKQLDGYFAGERTTFDLVVEPSGSPWQREVWTALTAIPYGETVSYGELGRRLGRPGAARAVGGANGANPVSIVVPCHRVVATGGGLGGYAWGVERKRWLLDHERRVTAAGAGWSDGLFAD